MRARVPIVAPVPATCVPTGTRVEADDDSSRYLLASLGYRNRRIPAGDSERLARKLARDVLAAREECRVQSPSGRGLTIVSDDPPFEAWAVSGTDGRVWLRAARDSVRWLMHWPLGFDGYMLSVDTLAGGADPARPAWVTVHSVKSPRPPRGYVLATDCSRGDAPGTGSIIAVVRETKTTIRGGASSAWEVDRSALRLAPTSTEDVRCRNPGWSWPSP